MRLELAAISSACALVAAAGFAAQSDAQTATTPPPSARWRETHAGLEEADTGDCLGCHADRMAGSQHPVDVDYARAAQRAGGSMRSIEEVRARGVVLRGGKVGCPTCHSPASPWRYFLAVPREMARARPTRAELMGDEPEGAVPMRTRSTPPKDGAEVDVRPLCEACHPKS